MNKPLTIWPAAMRRSTAALFVDMSVPAFERAVAAGDLPDAMPRQIGREPRWSREALEKAIRKAAGEVEGEVVVVKNRDAA